MAVRPCPLLTLTVSIFITVFPLWFKFPHRKLVQLTLGDTEEEEYMGTLYVPNALTILKE